MNRVLCSFCMLTFLVSSACGDKPFKNATARKAKTVYDTAASKAKVVYQAALKKAAADYVVQLDKAIKEAGGAGHLDEAIRISDEKKRIDADRNVPTTESAGKLRKRLEGTVWTIDPNQWLRFEKHGIAVKENGKKMVWVVTPKNTLVLQSYETTNLYVWQLDKHLLSARVTAFVKWKGTLSPARRRVKR